MLAKVIIENGVKKIQALTADTGTGTPVGSLISMYKKSSPSGYLYCDGSTFDETKYPALYQYLGSNVLPDYREFALVGAEENTTDVYNASTNPTGTIHDHDVYTEGQAKDDQVQDLEFNMSPEGASGNSLVYGSNTSGFSKLSTIGRSGNRIGTTTRGKRKAVYFYIKATSGLTENQQENVLNTINENNSYSTEEHPTGKKWIDGKPIYRRAYSGTVSSTGQTLFTATNLENVVTLTSNYKKNNLVFPAWYAGTAGFTWARLDTSNNVIWEFSSGNDPDTVTVTIEYTKTTD